MKKLLVLVGMILSFCVVAWCTSTYRVQRGDTITIASIATFPDGKVLQHYSETAPLTFTVGSWQVVAGLDNGVVGMKIGSKKTLTVHPKQWYGYLYSDSNIQKISRFIFEKLSISPQEGKIQKLGDIEWVIKGVQTDDLWEEIVLFDINPRETRDTLTYHITLMGTGDVFSD